MSSGNWSVETPELRRIVFGQNIRLYRIPHEPFRNGTSPGILLCAIMHLENLKCSIGWDEDEEGNMSIVLFVAAANIPFIS